MLHYEILTLQRNIYTVNTGSGQFLWNYPRNALEVHWLPPPQLSMTKYPTFDSVNVVYPWKFQTSASISLLNTTWWLVSATCI